MRLGARAPWTAGVQHLRPRSPSGHGPSLRSPRGQQGAATLPHALARPCLLAGAPCTSCPAVRRSRQFCPVRRSWRGLSGESWAVTSGLLRPRGLQVRLLGFGAPLHLCPGLSTAASAPRSSRRESGDRPPGLGGRSTEPAKTREHAGQRQQRLPGSRVSGWMRGRYAGEPGSSCTRHGEPEGTHKSVCVERAAIWFFRLVHPPPRSLAERPLTFPGTCLSDTRGGRRGAAGLEGRRAGIAPRSRPVEAASVRCVGRRRGRRGPGS